MTDDDQDDHGDEFDDTDADNYHRAYRSNLLRRDLTDGTKREVVKQYLLEHPDRVAEDTQEAIASDLGVSQKTVSNAVGELRGSGKLSKPTKINTEEKREQVREYVDANPTASNREVVKQYLLEHPDRVAEDTERDIASDLGVGKNTVHRAIAELRDNGKLVQVDQLSTEEKREVVKQYLLEHPDRVAEDSDRDIAQDLGVSKGTVQNARGDLEESGKLDKVVQLSTEEKREQVREYVDT